MIIYIKTLTKKIITLEIELSDAIANIKEKIKEKENIHPARQKLLFEGKELSDNKALSDYNIKKESRLQLSRKILYHI